VRDVTFREDAHQVRTGNGPAVFATLRNTSIGYHRINGATNIAEATRAANHRPHDLIDAVTTGKPIMTSSNPTLQYSPAAPSGHTMAGRQTGWT
jgi:hypothetical protein